MIGIHFRVILRVECQKCTVFNCLWSMLDVSIWFISHQISNFIQIQQISIDFNYSSKMFSLKTSIKWKKVKNSVFNFRVYYVFFGKATLIQLLLSIRMKKTQWRLYFLFCFGWHIFAWHWMIFFFTCCFSFKC